MKTSVELTDEEIVLLDGRCEEATQAIVTAAKMRIETKGLVALDDLTEDQRDFIARVVQAARANGRLTCTTASMRSCPVCKKFAGFAPLKRTCSKGRKGDPDHDRPLVLWGKNFVYSFVVMRDYPALGCCDDCCQALKPSLLKALDGVPAELPKALTGVEPRFRWHEKATCTKCGWAGHEGEMRKGRTLMGDGFYPSGCPKCPAANVPFGPRHVKIGGGFVVLPA